MTCFAMSPPCPLLQLENAAAGDALDRWRLDRLTEARSILGDVIVHPGSLVALAASVVIDHSNDPEEVARALALIDRRDPLFQLTESDTQFKNGGAA